MRAKAGPAFGKNRSQPDGLQRRCKECANTSSRAWRARHPDKSKASTRAWADKNPVRVAAKSKAWSEAHPERRAANTRASSLLRRYGLTLEAYDQLLASQGGRCAICATDQPGPQGRFHVDHDHATGNVRGILCHACNVGIGHLKDSADVLLKAARYLIRSAVPVPAAA